MQLLCNFNPNFDKNVQIKVEKCDNNKIQQYSD